MDVSDRTISTFRFSFGLEKLGLVALKAPVLSALIIVVLSGLAALGLSRLTVDDSLTELFRTDTKEFRQYETIDRLFPSSEFDVLIVASGPDLLTRKGIEAFREATIDLQLADGVNGLVSMMSARDKPDETGYAPPIVPDDLPEDDAEFDRMLERMRSNDIVKGKFLSDDGELALIVISLDRAAVAELGSRAVIEGLRSLAQEHFADTNIEIKLTGAPVMQLEIRNAVERDRLVYNSLGFLAGLFIAFLFFKRISLTIIAVAGPAIAILWTLGALGALDFRLNLFINVITPLILVQGFSDSMHLVLAVRRGIMAGVDRVEAAKAAVIDVAPACLLTAMNAGIAILSLSLAESALVRTFGVAALLAVGISYLAVAVVVPTLAALFVAREKHVLAHPEDERGGVGMLQRFTDRVMGSAARRPLLFTLLGMAAVVLTGMAYVQLEPRYRLADQVPDQEQALAGSAALDQKLTGANPVHVMIQLPKDGTHTLFDDETLAAIQAAHDILEKRAGLGNVWSLDSLRRWLAEAGEHDIETVKRYVSILPEHLVRRFISEDERAVLVTARMPDLDASEILPVVEQIDKELAPLRAAHPSYEIDVTGLPAIAARNSAKLISELNWGLVGDIFVIFIFLGLALRSVLVGVASILPSLFPIFATGALLWASGQGLQFASIIAITVAFSLAIDSTIHFLNRFRLEEDRLGGWPGSHVEALRRTSHHIGPAVVLTTIVLALGLGVTVLSNLPSLRLFGELSAICLLASLVAQLIILPATITLYRNWIPRRQR